MNNTRNMLKQMVREQSPKCEFSNPSMHSYRITNQVSGVNLGIYKADSVHNALDAMAIDAGYRNYSEAESVAPAISGEIVIVKLK